jgi:membrane protein DedA with SNARE-associated domain
MARKGIRRLMIQLASTLAQLDTSALEPILAIVRANTALVLPIVGLVGFIKSLPIVAAFLPSTILFVGVGGIYAASGGTFGPLWLAVAVGATLGDVVCYCVGRLAGEDAGKIWPISKYPDLIPKGKLMFAKYGVGSVLGAKFVWGLRPFIPIVAGIYVMPWWLFLPATTLSSMIWAGIGIGAGFSLPTLMK